ncbi:hypothetical protein [Streptomyces griseoaurantiacus]|uniref:Uncharacterized protein n=1 Tax=Streptomyces griseoaurantiacus TaxID=68213 RepID=A0A1G7QA88_9ACTN|nr:hypothetical protein [Streptomyces jietaisiensis]SDF95507.1 hypothetical protein SAMN05216260_112192 [Streptomyces jietaisiensis]
MHLRKRALTVVFLTTTALGALGAPAMAMPMPWETSNVPAAENGTLGVQEGNPWHGVAPAGSLAQYGNPWHGLLPDGQDGTVTVLCTGSCYE